MLLPAGDEPVTGTNHPLALRMGIIAFLNQAITVGSAWGSFSVLLIGNQARLGINAQQSTAAVPAMLLVLAFMAPVVGVLATRYPMRLVSLIGAVLSVVGFLVLALTRSYPLYLVGYALLLGPGLAVGSIMPSTLVTRWFRSGRGKALGLANIPLVFTIMPILASRVLHAYGLQVTYLMLAALAVVTLVANLFIADPPPVAMTVSPTAGAVAVEPAAAGGGLGALLKSRFFWILAIGANSSTVGSIILTANLVPMAVSWGHTLDEGAQLLSVFSLVAMLGPIFFGWLADRLGGTTTLALLLLTSGILWASLLIEPPYYPLLVVMGLIGFNAVGAAPVLSMAISQVFGPKQFSRAYGMANLVALPFTVLAVPATAAILGRTGSYAGAIAAETVFLLVMLLVVLSIRRRRTVTTLGPMEA